MQFEYEYDAGAIVDWAEKIRDAESYGEAARLTQRLIQEARVPANLAEPDPEDGPEDPKAQRPGESKKAWAKRLGYGKNDFGAPGYNPNKPDTTWDGYSIGDRYMDH